MNLPFFAVETASCKPQKKSFSVETEAKKQEEKDRFLWLKTHELTLDIIKAGGVIDDCAGGPEICDVCY